MQLRGAATHYGLLAIVLHWLTAVAVLALLVLGFRAASAADPDQQAALLRVHIPLGLLVLLMTLTRIVWWSVDFRPDPPDGQPRWQVAVSHVVHVALYGALLVLTASGIGIVIVSGLGPMIFSGQPLRLPDLTVLKPFLAHRTAAFTLLGLASLHVGAAIYHQLYRRDRLLARMGVGHRIS